MSAVELEKPRDVEAPVPERVLSHESWAMPFTRDTMSASVALPELRDGAPGASEPPEYLTKDEWLRRMKELDREENALPWSWAPKSAELSLRSAEWCLTGKERFGKEWAKTAYTKLGWTSSKWRKKITTAKAAPRLWPILNLLPPNWTLIYQLAKLELDAFDRVTKHPAFGPKMKARQLADILGSAPKGASKYLRVNVSRCSAEKIARIEELLSQEGVQPRRFGFAAEAEAFHSERSEVADV